MPALANGHPLAFHKQERNCRRRLSGTTLWIEMPIVQCDVIHAIFKQLNAAFLYDEKKENCVFARSRLRDPPLPKKLFSTPIFLSIFFPTPLRKFRRKSFPGFIFRCVRVCDHTQVFESLLTFA
jgi:hypothetical protein